MDRLEVGLSERVLGDENDDGEENEIVDWEYIVESWELMWVGGRDFFDL